MSNFYGNTRLAGMGAMEAFIWTKFLEAHGPEYTDYEYNVKLARPISIPASWPEEYKKNAQDLTSYRIDVTMRSKGTIWIVEVRPDASHSAIGSLIFYRFLYMLQFNPNEQVKMILCTNKYTPAIELTTRAAGIVYNVF